MAEPRPFSVADVRRRVAARWSGDRGTAAGDHVLNPGLAELLLSRPHRRAAVLVPVVERQPEATILLTLRTSYLRAHAGQIAFPGGTIDAADGGPAECALRETFEEIGIDPASVEVLGLSSEYLTGSGYSIVPVLGIVSPGFELRLNSNEVADVFEVPLRFVMDPENHRKGSREWDGATRYFFEMPFGERHIWGITAGILHGIYEHLYAERAHEALGVTS